MKNITQSWRRKFILSLEEFYTDSEIKAIWRILMEDGLGRELIDETPFNDSEQKQLLKFIAELLEYRPVQYVVGKSLFMEEYFKVDELVLIPRPETEELVRTIIKDSNPLKRKVLEIGTGTGCIAICLKKHFPSWELTAIDSSEAALENASENSERLEVSINLQNNNFLDETQWFTLGDFDLIVSNPPYIAKKEASLMATSVLDYEPMQALFPEGDDALIFYKKIRDYAKKYLTENGSIYLELNEFNAQEVIALFRIDSFSEVNLIKDLQNKDRILCIKK